MTYAILGYLMIALIVILLLTNKANPIMAFIIIPPVIALVAGYTFKEINDFIKAGVSASTGTALLALLSIIFFSFKRFPPVRRDCTIITHFPPKGKRFLPSRLTQPRRRVTIRHN